MSKKIAVIGECMIELSQKGAEVSRGFGGDTLNTPFILPVRLRLMHSP
jgi:2-dehydro-3-deoxygluconokinase